MKTIFFLFLEWQLTGLFPAILEKGLWSKLGKKMSDLTSKLGEINDIEHNKGSKIYPQNQVILDCIMPSIPLKHKWLRIILIWVIVSHKKKWPLIFTFLYLGKTDMVLGKKMTVFD